jgi:glycerophosphoryl diester phosphodiesterase
MKNFAIISLMLLAGCASGGDNFLDKQAHRGGRGLMPENTIPAMLDAIDRNVTTLEMDVYISRDKKVVVSHDSYFHANITTTPEGEFLSKEETRRLLYAMDYDSICKYDVGLKQHPDFPQQKKIKAVKPLLSELIKAVEEYASEKGKAMRYNIEIKSRPADDNTNHPPVEEFVDLAMAVISAGKIDDRTVIQSFDTRALQYLHQRYPAIALSYLIGKNEKRTPAELWEELGFVPHTLSPEYMIVTNEMIRECHAAGVKVLPWTVNELPEINRLHAMHVDGIITDYPNLFESLSK